jgi:hypothetical protein
MRKVAKLIVVALFIGLLGPIAGEAQVFVNVGVNLPVFPQLVVVPNYPVYYAPDVRGNYFFYDGLFWVFNVEDGYWYSSSWYNGPWVYVEPFYVPQPILVVPYRYYRVRPAYWVGWELERPPRWGIQWGGEWEVRRRDWEHWDRRRYVTAPLPLFQREYVRERYPSPSQQVIIYKQKYTYKPVDVHVREVHSTVLERQSQGGFKARDRADFVVKGRQDRTVREETGLDRGQGKDKGRHEEKGIREGKANPVKKGQVEEKGFHGNNGQHQDKGLHEEKGIREGKGNREEKGIREGKAQPQKGEHEKGHEKAF